MNRVYRAVNIQKQSFFQMLKRRKRHMEQVEQVLMLVNKIR